MLSYVRNKTAASVSHCHSSRNRLDVGNKLQRRNCLQTAHIQLLHGRVQEISRHLPRAFVVAVAPPLWVAPRISASWLFESDR
jgi:hypothetical protein